MTLTDVSVELPSLSASLAVPIAEYCEKLFVRLSDFAQQIQTVGLTSCTRSEGVTTVAAQFAITAAGSLGLPVALVDCNLVNPCIHKVFDVPIGPGLRDAMWETAPIHEFLQPSSVKNLSLLTAGHHRNGSSLAFNSPSLKRVLHRLNDEFGLVVIDLPTFSQGVPPGLGALLDGLLLVMEAERIRWHVGQCTTSLLTEAGVNILGVVMNKRQNHVPQWLYESF